MVLFFHAIWSGRGIRLGFDALQNGSRVAVTGVCLIEAGNDWIAGENWRAKSFRILMRSPGDVAVLRNPPWWNLSKLLWAVGILAAIVLGASVWVAVLRGRVHEQTEIISQQLRDEAKLRERYADLLENANDIVYTHDLSGRITSVNRTGEELLLRRKREEILSRNILDLVAPEQQAAAQGRGWSRW